VRIAKEFKPFSEEQMAALRQRAKDIKGPLLEDWKRNVEPQVAILNRPAYLGS
jgi:hypothetical protein